MCLLHLCNFYITYLGGLNNNNNKNKNIQSDETHQSGRLGPPSAITQPMERPTSHGLETRKCRSARADCRSCTARADHVKYLVTSFMPANMGNKIGVLSMLLATLDI